MVLGFAGAGITEHPDKALTDAVNREIPSSAPQTASLDAVLGLPDHVSACLFDLDGVLTETASIHDAAWKKTFDAYLDQRSARTGEVFSPFDPVKDYESYVDGKPRADGVRSFLASRGITLLEGSPNDPPDTETINGLGNRKNRELLHRIAADGVTAFPGSVEYLRAIKSSGVKSAVVSSSANCREIVEAAHLSGFFTVRVDGITIHREHLPGKPAPDSFLAAARMLGVSPHQAAIFEDALAGVEAGRAGKFGWVVGVDRTGHSDQLREHGADVVVTDLAHLLDKD